MRGENKCKSVVELTNLQLHFSFASSTWSLSCTTYTDGGVLVQLVFGCNAEACAVATSGPCQVDCCLQLVAHLLVNGASKLRSIIALKDHKHVTKITNHKKTN